MGGYERVMPPEILHYIGKDKTQRLERTNGIVRQQTERWHRRQNKFGKLWELSESDDAISGELFQLDLAA
jgi:IS1 family transposase